MKEPPEHFEPDCGVFIDLCTGRLWRPLRDSMFEPLGSADTRAVAAMLEPMLRTLRDARAALPSARQLLTFAEAANRIGLAPKTLYEWKRIGKLRHEDGLRRVNGALRIDWTVLSKCIEKGGLR